jgi:hypothetical protein
MKKKVFLILLILFITFGIASSLYANIGIRIGGGVNLPFVVPENQDVNFFTYLPGDFIYTADIGIYYIFENGGSLGLDTTFSLGLDIHIHLAYQYEFKVNDYFMPGLVATSGFSFIKGVAGFGIGGGGQLSFKIYGYTKLGVRALLTFSFAYGDYDNIVSEPGIETVLSMPITLFVTFGW